MEGNSKESDGKDNSGQQNNNSIETESNQQNCSTNEKELKIESTPSKMINNDSNGCDNGNSETTTSQKQDDTNHKGVKANDEEVTDMEMGSPEKQLVIESKKEKPSSNSPPKSESNVNKEANIDFKVIYNKKKYDISVSPDTDIGALKTHLHPIIDIPPAMMKVISIILKEFDIISILYWKL